MKKRKPSASRLLLLPHLPVFDKHGHATAELHRKSGYKGSITALTSLLKEMESDGLVTRVVRGSGATRLSRQQRPPLPATRVPPILH